MKNVNSFCILRLSCATSQLMESGDLFLIFFFFFVEVEDVECLAGFDYRFSNCLRSRAIEDVKQRTSHLLL